MHARGDVHHINFVLTDRKIPDGNQNCLPQNSNHSNLYVRDYDLAVYLLSSQVERSIGEMLR